MDIFTNRELAIIIWLAIFIAFLLCKKAIRGNTILSVIKSILNRKILAYLVSFLFYFSLFIYFFYYFGWWDASNLKDTIIWYIFAGIPIGFVVATSKLKNGYWRSLILNNLKLTVLVEFIVNFFTFPIIVELVIVPVIALLAWINSYSKHFGEYKDVEKLTTSLLSVFGLFMLFYSLSRAIFEYNSIGNVNALKSLLFPVVYSLVSIPYMYAFKLVVEYEKLFIRLKLGKKRSKKLNFLIKLRLLLFCNIQMKRLQVATSMSSYNLMSIASEDEIDIMIKSYEDVLSRETAGNVDNGLNRL